MSEDEEKRIAEVVATWQKIVTQLGRMVGPLWEQVDPPLMLQLKKRASPEGRYTNDDVRAACRAVFASHTFEACRTATQWVGAFVVALDQAAGKRTTADRQRRMIEATKVTPEEREKTGGVFAALMAERGIERRKS